MIADAGDKDNIAKLPATDVELFELNGDEDFLGTEIGLGLSSLDDLSP
jgi:hypothetical protein